MTKLYMRNWIIIIIKYLFVSPLTLINLQIITTNLIKLLLCLRFTFYPSTEMLIVSIKSARADVIISR